MASPSSSPPVVVQVIIPTILVPAPKRGVWPPGGRPQGHLLARGRDAGTNTSVSTPSTTSTAAEPIHDWPFALLQEMIPYKAKAAGILIEMVNPAYTSVTCRQCSQTNREYRDGTEFHCTHCGYEVHADVNAAINLAMRWLKK